MTEMMMMMMIVPIVITLEGIVTVVSAEHSTKAAYASKSWLGLTILMIN